VSLSLVAVSLGNVRIEFEIKTKLSPCCLFARESWLWCVGRVFSFLTGLNSVFRNAIKNATQLFFNRIPQMTKYYVMRECENIPTGISLCSDSAFAHKKEFSIFKFPERFLEIARRDLTIFSLC
jgi:hypothetical protein